MNVKMDNFTIKNKTTINHQKMPACNKRLGEMWQSRSGVTILLKTAVIMTTDKRYLRVMQSRVKSVFRLTKSFFNRELYYKKFNKYESLCQNNFYQI